MSKKFEYKRVEWIDNPPVIEDLNQEGLNGWELIYADKYLVDPSDSIEFVWYGVFKREIE